MIEKLRIEIIIWYFVHSSVIEIGSRYDYRREEIWDRIKGSEYLECREEAEEKEAELEQLLRKRIKKA